MNQAARLLLASSLFLPVMSTVAPQPACARVIALRKSQSGSGPFDDFALETAGGTSLLPSNGPIGLAVHAARSGKDNPSKDAAKLADRIVKRIDGDIKAGRAGVSGN